MVDTIYCVHCGAVAKHPVTKTIDGRVLNFCCGGCLQVYEMLREEGLESGQSKQEPQTFSQPAGTMPSKTITLPIIGMSCANCVARVERSLRSVPGVLSVSVDLASGNAMVEMVPDVVTMADLSRSVEDAGYEVPHASEA
jgi:copper chaperone CopZ